MIEELKPLQIILDSSVLRIKWIKHTILVLKIYKETLKQGQNLAINPTEEPWTKQDPSPPPLPVNLEPNFVNILQDLGTLSALDTDWKPDVPLHWTNARSLSMYYKSQSYYLSIN